MRVLVAVVVAGDRNLAGPHVRKSLKRALLKALHVDVTKRYASARDLRHALETALPVVSWGPSTTVVATLASPTRLISRIAAFYGYDVKDEGEKAFAEVEHVGTALGGHTPATLVLRRQCAHLVHRFLLIFRRRSRS